MKQGSGIRKKGNSFGSCAADCRYRHCAVKSAKVRRTYSKRETPVFGVTDAARGQTAMCDNTECECAPGKSRARRMKQWAIYFNHGI